MARHLHIGIARLNKAITEYSLARLEFTLLYPQLSPPPLMQRVGSQATDVGAPGNWAEIMRKIALLQHYIEVAKTSDTTLEREAAFERLAKAANHVAVIAWSMESMHRRRGGTIG